MTGPAIRGLKPSPIAKTSLEAKEKAVGITKRRRQAWSKKEDDHLNVLVKWQPHSRIVWTDIARELNQRLNTSRSGKQCRERWLNHLRPNIKKGDWSPREESMIFTMHEQYGPKWTIMAKLLPNRSENDIKNKYNSMKRSQQCLVAKGKILMECEEFARKSLLNKQDQVDITPLSMMTCDTNSTDIIQQTKCGDQQEGMLFPEPELATASSSSSFGNPWEALSSWNHGI
eukprot:Nitzschia sp. Nitz4//scaffold35_size145790//76406//77245//NITZ4_003031-RA/size145790-processed-gene-0.202-mRNA-1//1//CDS//3329549127//8978//frame0